MWWRVPTREVGGVPLPEGLELPPEYLAADPSKSPKLQQVFPQKSLDRQR